MGYDDAGRMVSAVTSYTPPQERRSDRYGSWRHWFSRPRSDNDTSFDRRYEWRGSRRSIQEEEVVVEKRKQDGYVIEDRLVYDEKPRYWWLFILLGILLIVLGVVNILFCLDLHFYTRFFAGVAVRIIIYYEIFEKR